MTEEEQKQKIEEVLENQINPAIAAHGGVVELLDYKDGAVFLKFGGGCQGCAGITATLRGGVEQMLRSEVPEVKEIFDTTEHAEGKNPYFQA